MKTGIRERVSLSFPRAERGPEMTKTCVLFQRYFYALYLLLYVQRMYENMCNLRY